MRATESHTQVPICERRSNEKWHRPPLALAQPPFVSTLQSIFLAEKSGPRASSSTGFVARRFHIGPNRER